MELKLSKDDLGPLVETVVCEVLRRGADLGADGAERIAYSEPEAAALLGVRRHVLRDARLRGEIRAAKIGKAYRYLRSDLLKLFQVKGT